MAILSNLPLVRPLHPLHLTGTFSQLSHEHQPSQSTKWNPSHFSRPTMYSHHHSDRSVRIPKNTPGSQPARPRAHGTVTLMTVEHHRGGLQVRPAKACGCQPGAQTQLPCPLWVRWQVHSVLAAAGGSVRCPPARLSRPWGPGLPSGLVMQSHSAPSATRSLPRANAA